MNIKKALFNRIFSILLVCTIILTSFSPVFAADTARAAKVTDLAGTVNVFKSGGEKRFSAFKGMSLT